MFLAMLLVATGCHHPKAPQLDAGFDSFVPTPITLAITSHAAGTRIIGARSITLAGTWDGDASLIFVAAYGSGRVMVWDSFPTANGAAANRVLGATGLGSPTSAVVNASTIGGPSGLLVLDDHLVVSDAPRSRVLLYARP